MAQKCEKLEIGNLFPDISIPERLHPQLNIIIFQYYYEKHYLYFPYIRFFAFRMFKGFHAPSQGISV